MMIPALGSHRVHAVTMAEKVARTFNLDADRDLLASADADALINKYLEDPVGRAPPVSPTL